MSATSTWTSTSPSAGGSGRGTSSSRRSPGPWKISALIAATRAERQGDRLQPVARVRDAHGTSTTFNAAPLAEQRERLLEPLERQHRRLRQLERGEERDRLLHVRRRRRARPDHRQLAPVHPGGGQRAGVGEEQHRAAGLDGVERRLAAARRAEHGRVDRPVRRDARPLRDAGRPRTRCRRAAPSTAPKSRPMKPLPTTSTRPRGTRSAPRRTQASGSTYVPRASSTAAGSSTQPVARTRSANPPGTIVGSGNCSQVDSCPREAARARAAARVVDQRDAAPVGGQRDDLVPEHRARAPATPIFSTSEPQSPQASTSTSSPGGRRLRDRRPGAGSPAASRTTARIGVS